MLATVAVAVAMASVDTVVDLAEGSVESDIDQ
jgi:hypothetical protein